MDSQNKLTIESFVKEFRNVLGISAPTSISGITETVNKLEEHTEEIYDIYRKLLLRTSTSYTIPDGTEIVRDTAFAGCSYLKSIEIPDSVKAIGEKAFSECEGLEAIRCSFPRDSVSGAPWGADENTEILYDYDSAQDCAGVTLPTDVSDAIDGTITFLDASDLDDLRPYALADCASLSSVVLPDNMTKIPNGLFMGCKQLAKLSSAESSGDAGTLIIPANVTHIGDYAFKGTAFSKVVIYSGIQSIGSEAFADCEKLKEVVFAEGISVSHSFSMGSKVFANCENLRCITMPLGIRGVSRDVFSESYISTVYYREAEPPQSGTPSNYQGGYWGAGAVEDPCETGVTMYHDYYKITGDDTSSTYVCGGIEQCEDCSGDVAVKTYTVNIQRSTGQAPDGYDYLSSDYAYNAPGATHTPGRGTLKVYYKKYTKPIPRRVTKAVIAGGREADILIGVAANRRTYPEGFIIKALPDTVCHAWVYVFDGESMNTVEEDLVITPDGIDVLSYAKNEDDVVFVEHNNKNTCVDEKVMIVSMSDGDTFTGVF